MFRHITLANKNFQKYLKTKKLPSKMPQNHKSNNEYSGELMLKTKKIRH